jgi:GT2 family glycosyltransferase/glycosyltransferase involved in cell wall biosynthesis
MRRIIKMISHYIGRENDEKKIIFQTHLLRLAQNNSMPEIYRTIPVDIIIPVYNAFEYTKKCIESVLQNSSNCRLIIIDDASSDSKIRDYLETLKSIPEKSIELITLANRDNMGFLKSVNLAAEHVENHFVILNSDTEVPPGWLDRLFYPIIKDEDAIASVTPFSNAGMICSFPEFSIDNDIFKNLSTETLDKFFSLYGSREPIELPTGIGFCMAFNKKLVDRIGLFDEVMFGKGYGEENDWCMRASSAGFKNTMITNLFVYHKHGASFSEDDKKNLTGVNMKNLLKKHPDYMFLIEAFIKEDSPKDIRDSIAVIADAHTRGDKKLSVIIDNDLGGGAHDYALQLIRELREGGGCVLHFKFHFHIHGNYLKLIYKGDSIEKEFIFAAQAVEDFDKIILLFKPDIIFINELVPWSEPIKVIDKIIALNLPYIPFVHDYFYVCQNWNLINQHERFCGIPKDANVCSDCLSESTNSDAYVFYSGSFYDISLWRKKMCLFLQGAVKVVCFSENSAAYISSVYPDLSNISVIEHVITSKELFPWKKRKLLNDTSITIAVVGGIGFHKGVSVIQKLIEHPDYKKLSVNIVVIGNTLLWPDGYVSTRKKFRVHGRYNRKYLSSLLEQYHVSAVLIPSICPETFSFTTSEALLLGYPVICFNLGASADRIRKHQCGIVVDDNSVEALLEAVSKLINQPQLIEELSANTARYAPISEQKHSAEILKLIK